MNGLFRRILLVCMTIGMVVGFAACDKENDEPDKPVVEQPGDDDDLNDKADYEIYAYSPALEMSCQEYKKVVLVELHSNISDLELSFVTAPEEYNEISFIKEDEKDSHGFYVYRAYMDMPAVTEKYGGQYISTWPSLSEQYINIDLKLTFSGTGLKDGENVPVEYKKDVTVKRYLANGCQFRYWWKLTEHRIVPMQNLMKWNEENSNYDIDKGEKYSYTSATSPLKVVNILDEEYIKGGVTWPGSIKFRKTEELFGWPNKTEIEILGAGYSLFTEESNYLIDGSDSKPLNLTILSLVVNKKYVNTTGIGSYFKETDGTMVCCSDEYDEAGMLVAQHYYVFKFE